MTQTPRVRFAPSPTGYLHVGGARTALFNWLFARKHGGIFVLRIEDTDRERSSHAMTQAILHGMQWLGLGWDEGPFHQGDGLARHQADARRLLQSGHAYRCFCTPEQLQARRAAAGGEDPDAYRYDRACLAIPVAEAERRAAAGEPFTIRCRVPDGVTEWDDAVHGPTRFQNADLEDFVILRSDGTPTYNFAVVSDDLEMRITHVLRGDDHLSNTPKQIVLYRGLGAELPVFGHLPMILGPDGKRLSKRHGATAVGEYEQQGILPQALVNFLALLGWNPGDEQEVMTLAEMVQKFELARINKKSAVFDTAKLEWMNQQHLMRLSAAELMPLVLPGLARRGLADEAEVAARRAWFETLVDLLKPRSRTPDEIAEQARTYLVPEVTYDEAAVARHWQDAEAAARALCAIRSRLETLDPWTPPAVEAALRALAAELGVGFGKLVHPLRLALTGSAASPGIDAVVALLGRERVRQRLAAALRRLQGETGPGQDD